MTTQTKTRSKTPFTEKNGDNRHTLGNPRWERIPAIPERKRAQEVVSDVEQAKAKTLLEEFRATQTLRDENDIQSIREHQGRLEHERRFPEAEEVKRKLVICNHQTFLSASDKLITLTDKAADLVVPALDRLIESFDDELNAYAIRREDDLMKYGQPLYQEIPNNGNRTNYVNAPTQPTYIKLWTLWDDKICTQLHSCREVVRNLRQKFNGFQTYTRREILDTHAIPTLQHLFTSEDINFSWL